MYALSSPDSSDWFATDGHRVVGPTSYSELAARVAAARLSESAWVRNAKWRVWKRWHELASLDEPARDALVRELAAISAEAELRVTSPDSEPPPPPSGPARRRPVARSEPPGPRSRRSIDPIGVLSRCTTLSDALSLTLTTAIAATHAEVGLLHRFRPDVAAVVTAFAHGRGSEVQLGERLSDSDPVIVAARAGRTVIAEPHPGECGRYLDSRVGRFLEEPVGLAMVPIVALKSFVAAVEIGRTDVPFSARELARVEDIAEALVGRGVVAGWFH